MADINKKRRSACCARCAKFLIDKPRLSCVFKNKGQKCNRCAGANIKAKCNEVSDLSLSPFS